MSPIVQRGLLVHFGNILLKECFELASEQLGFQVNILCFFDKRLDIFLTQFSPLC